MERQRHLRSSFNNKLINNNLINLLNIHLFIFIYLTAITSASCPTSFFAQAFSKSKSATLKLYHKKSSINTAAACATYCGLQAECHSALYNHDTKSCALSTLPSTDCSPSRQRYNTFHLKTDGADSLSIIGCVDVCRSERDTVDKSDSPTVEVKKNGFRLRATPIVPSVVTSHGLDRLNSNEDASNQSQLFIKGTASAVQPIIPVNYLIPPPGAFAHSIDGTNKTENYIQRSSDHERDAKSLWPRRDYTAQFREKGGHSASVAQSPSSHHLVQKMVNGHMIVRDLPGPSNASDSHGIVPMDEYRAQTLMKAISHLNTIQEYLRQFHQMDERNIVNASSWNLKKHGDAKSNKTVTSSSVLDLSPNSKVRFNAQPLTFQEIFGGAANARDRTATLDETQTKLYKAMATATTDEKSSANLIHNSSSGAESHINSGGFVVLLQPDRPKFNSERSNESIHQYRRNDDDASTERMLQMQANKIMVDSQRDARADDGSAVRIPSDPIVINGKILTSKEKVELMSQEHTTTTTTTTVAPWSPAGLIGESSINEPELVETAKNSNAKHYNGYLNKFVIHGIASMMNRHYDEDSHKKLNGATTLTVVNTPTPAVVCFRLIGQQRLLHGVIRRVENVTLNGCRCKCASTWKNTTKIIGTADEDNYCKSVQYYAKTRSCILNSADHNSKYDLIYDKNADYYYVSCQIPQLVHMAQRKCKTKSTVKNLKTTVTSPKNKISTTSETTPTIKTTSVRITVLPKTTTTVAASLTSPRFEKVIKSEEVPNDHTTVAEIDRINNNSKAESNTVNAKRLEKSQTVSPKLNSEKSTVATTVKSTTAPKATTIKTIQQIVSTITNQSTTVAEITVSAIETKTITSVTKTTTEGKTTKTTKSGRTMFEGLKSTQKPEEGCFERIAGHAMNASAGAVVRDVSLAQCECACAGSMQVFSISSSQILQQRAFQCASATYFHKDRECILNLANREQRAEFFVHNPEEAADTQITYLGLLCPPVKAYDELYQAGFCPKSLEPSVSPATYNPATTSSITTAEATPHTDDCFLELPNHVLEGPALAIETNVTVEECKCYCVDSENRYGSICQSVLYYFDSATCLLNKENRITNPNQFTFNGQSNVIHSYFDYRCYVEHVTLLMYIEQVCQVATQLTIKDLLKNKSSSLNIDEKSREAKSQHSYEDHPNEKTPGGYSKSDPIRSTTKPMTTVRPIIRHQSSSVGKFENFHMEKDGAKQRSNGSSPTTSEQIKDHSEKRKVTVQFEQEITEEDTLIQSTTTKARTTISNKPKRPIFIDQHLHDQMELEERKAKLAGKKKTNDDKNNHNEEKEIDKKNEEPDSDYESKKKAKAKAQIKRRQSKIIVTPKEKTKSIVDDQKTNKIFKKIESRSRTTADPDEIAEVEEDDDYTDANGNDNGKVMEKKPDENSDKHVNAVEPQPTTTTSALKSGRQSTVVAGNGMAMTKLATITNASKKPDKDKEKPFEYPPVESCQYSALYQTVFNGFRMIKRVMVKSPLQCFAACHTERCRSANLVQAEGVMKYCELFRDSIVDFRRTDVLGFDRGAVHFDSIQCQRADV